MQLCVSVENSLFLKCWFSIGKWIISREQKNKGEMGAWYTAVPNYSHPTQTYYLVGIAISCVTPRNGDFWLIARETWKKYPGMELDTWACDYTVTQGPVHRRALQLHLMLLCGHIKKKNFFLIHCISLAIAKHWNQGKYPSVRTDWTNLHNEGLCSCKRNKANLDTLLWIVLRTKQCGCPE